jgi:hypothetical protein
MYTPQTDYTNKQLAAGLECVAIWRKQNGVLSDESLCGMIFDAMRAAAPTAVEEPGQDVSYEIVQDDMAVASASGQNALAEIMHYAQQYEHDGSIEIFKVVRTAVDPANPTQQDRHAKQAAGTHPAPCARHCEAVAFKAEISRLKAETDNCPDGDPNAPWLSLAHMICSDAGIPPGHITTRLEALREKLDAPSDAAMLDWLEKSTISFCGNYSGTGFRMIGSSVWHGTLREAIAGAMKENA